jgi:nucleoside-diphosphate-sugar epimerase
MGDHIAITGANGFVGRHLTLFASSLGWDVLGLVRSETAARAVEQAGGRFALVNPADTESLARALGGARAVVHLAQIGAERNGMTYDDVNVAGTSRVIEAAHRAGVPRVVYFSGLGVLRYGQKPRCTNRYFLSKLAAEVELFRSDREVAIFRPSYVVGHGDAFVPMLLGEMAAGEVERPGDGAYRMQPIAVTDAVALVLAAIEMPILRGPLVLDLVGPEPLSFARFVDRLARVARVLGQPADFQVREIPIEDADEEAAAGGYRGMYSDELDCLLCDEVADHAPLEALLGRFLTPLDEALAATVRGAGVRS